MAYCAKIDNPTEYEKIIKQRTKEKRDNSLDGNSYSIAKAFHSKYLDVFVCSYIKIIYGGNLMEHAGLEWKKHIK